MEKIATITTEIKVEIAESLEALGKKVGPRLDEGFQKGKSGDVLIDNSGSPLTVYYQILIKIS